MNGEPRPDLLFDDGKDVSADCFFYAAATMCRLLASYRESGFLTAGGDQAAAVGILRLAKLWVPLSAAEQSDFIRFASNTVPASEAIREPQPESTN